MLRLVCTFVVVAILYVVVTDAPAIARTPDQCGAEDSASWVWSECGNRKRGVILRDGTRAVVGPCAFRRAFEGDSIDWTRTARLRGDYVARTARCTVRPRA